MDLQVPAGLPTHRADTPAPAQTDRHDHPLAAEADVDHGCPGQAEQPLECSGDAHVALPFEPLTFDSQQPRAEGGGASLTFCATSANFSNRRTGARARQKHGLSADYFTHKSPGDYRKCTPKPSRQFASRTPTSRSFTDTISTARSRSSGRFRSRARPREPKLPRAGGTQQRPRRGSRFPCEIQPGP